MDFQHDHPSEGPSNRSFGYTVGGILLGLVLAKWLISGALSTTSICMAVVGGALVPLELLLRVRGRQPLAMSFDRAAASYWISRPRGEPVPATMCYQF